MCPNVDEIANSVDPRHNLSENLGTLRYSEQIALEVCMIIDVFVRCMLPRTWCYFCIFALKGFMKFGQKCPEKSTKSETSSGSP